MPINQDRADFFWLGANDPVTTEMPEPETFQDSKITPLFDLGDYAIKLNAALATVGVNADPNQNQGDFIYIAGWWLGLMGGQVTEPTPGLASTGYSFEDQAAFNLDGTNPAADKLIDVLKDKARRGVDVRVLGWISYAIMTDTPHPLLWVFPPLQTAVANSLQANNAGIRSMALVNAQTMNSIKALREEPKLAKKCQLNILAHSAGAVHVKGCIVGNVPNAGNATAIAFTGGLDFEQGRWAGYGHVPNAAMMSAPRPRWAPAIPTPYWHDIQAAIEGPAAQGFFNFFLQMWNENLARDVQDFRFEGARIKTRVTGTPPVSPITIDASPLAPGGLTHHVQSLRTIPAFNYHWYNCLPEGEAASFAQTGRFEYRAALEKAISNAERYIYIEDQSYSSREIMEWINARIAARPNLRVILVKPGNGDPNDAPTDTSAIDYEVFARGLMGINKGDGPSVTLTAAQRNQARMFRLWGESIIIHDENGTPWAANVATVDTSVAGEVRVTFTGVNAPADSALPADFFLGAHQYAAHYIQFPGGNKRILGSLATAANQPVVFRLGAPGAAPAVGDAGTFTRTYGIVVHSKVVIIDDKWALIGSANSMRRSLYTDWEHSVAFLDSSQLPSDVKEFRKSLWAEHFATPANVSSPGAFDNLDEAIGAWDPADAAWKTTPTTPLKPSRPAGDLGPAYIQNVPLPTPAATEVPFDDKTRSHYAAYADPDSRQDWGGIKP